MAWSNIFWWVSSSFQSGQALEILRGLSIWCTWHQIGIGLVEYWVVVKLTCSTIVVWISRLRHGKWMLFKVYVRVAINRWRHELVVRIHQIDLWLFSLIFVVLFQSSNDFFGVNRIFLHPILQLVLLCKGIEHLFVQYRILEVVFDRSLGYHCSFGR